jgi:hypothetical protein
LGHRFFGPGFSRSGKVINPIGLRTKAAAETMSHYLPAERRYPRRWPPGALSNINEF